MAAAGEESSIAPQSEEKNSTVRSIEGTKKITKVATGLLVPAEAPVVAGVVVGSDVDGVVSHFSHHKK